MNELNAMNGNEGIKYAELREQVAQISNGNKNILSIFDDLKALDKNNDGKISNKELEKYEVFDILRLKLVDFLETVNKNVKDSEVKLKLKNVVLSIDEKIQLCQLKKETLENLKKSQSESDSSKTIDKIKANTIKYGLEDNNTNDSISKNEEKDETN